ncbi:bifunctional diaminohydroxyphosphoribosylaminopyrimidine deaminase/5-amino-6-(5-phosphoribosylamino)uracil reductase RibD [Aliagarivorans marinus]|uniref:bifunctional diaminohydroxyphosphoribosylaminopyrimidine deaminase/5-amino-6-(5-phosphoribosylamino)uracil reductase RibD n=1 Tax=Aliagarivorans marinus TaxID=561965 RepID=UPI0003FED97B|nr:bifunctional diaminohydroxyphosphoribosylaminopyrimidine deaminase/5-amino-6-(5-phosphoribosylamino)uracil reductase RibD [Aliagarivorans marinus]
MAEFSAQDCRWMARAIQLAKRGRYTTAPNPNVGCVIVRDGQLLGEGFHRKAGEGHAEVNAIADAKAKGHSLQGATCYVTLEPCAHQGRTPSCARTLAAEQVAEVVMAMVDPNPLVAGKGVAILQEAGIAVRSGLMSDAARALNPGFLSRVERARPQVKLKLACSIDGRTALANGESKWITGNLARQDVQRERACSHAILSTAATVIRDDASLNVRHGELGSLREHYSEQSLRQPVRVIIDRQGRLAQAGSELKLFNSPGEVWLLSYAEQALPAEMSAKVKQLIVPAGDNWLMRAMQLLSTHEINDLWVEAGAALAAALLDAELVDQLISYQAGVLMGQDALPLFALQGYTEMARLSRWQLCEQRVVGPDIKTTWRQRS